MTARDRPPLSTEELRSKIAKEIAGWEDSDELLSELSHRLIQLIIESGWGNLACKGDTDSDAHIESHSG